MIKRGVPFSLLQNQRRKRSMASSSASSIIIPQFLSGCISRRNLLLSTTLPTVSPPQPSPSPDVTITDRVFLDFSLCPTYFRSESSDPPCSESTPLGRVVLGLYGRHVPITVSTFKLMCSASSSQSYKNTPVHEIFPGQFFLAGRQTGRRVVLKDLPRNTDVVNPKAFSLPHSRPGLLSLCLTENDDDDEARLDPEYRNVEFLITTGPGPCPQLDGANIVFGTVLQGLDVVTSIATVPTYKPSENIKQFNDFAEFIGDERAQNARSLWNRPLKTVFISNCGELKHRVTCFIMADLIRVNRTRKYGAQNSCVRRILNGGGSIIKQSPPKRCCGTLPKRETNLSIWDDRSMFFTYLHDSP